MRYTFWAGTRAKTLGEHEQDLLNDDAARIEALAFVSNVLREAASEVGNLTVEVRDTDGKLRVSLQISSFGRHHGDFAEEEMAQEGEGHPS